MEKESKYERFLRTYSGKKLLEEHSLNEEGVWEIRGEDENCDLGGPHHEPRLGHVSGKLGDVIAYAVELSGFWTWGGGGRIIKSRPPRVKKINSKTNYHRKRLEEKVAKLEAELAEAKKELANT